MDDVTIRKETTDRARVEMPDNGTAYRGLARIPAARRWLRRKLALAVQRGDKCETRALRKRLGMDR